MRINVIRPAIFTIVLSFLLTTGFIFKVNAATTQLLLSPVRIIFTDNQRVIKAHVINLGTETVAYSISLLTMRRGEDGKLFKPVEENEDEKLANSLIRYSPRRATIEPRGRQVVKLMLRKPKDLPLGEYRTKLLLSPLPPKSINTENTNQQASSQDNGIRFSLDYIVRTSFPIIIQNGVQGSATPIDITINKDQSNTSDPTAKVTLSRKGKGSAFGHIYVFHIPENDKKEKNVGQVQGAAIYLPDSEKTFNISLHDITSQELSSGSIRVEFHPNTGIPGKRRKVQPVSSRTFDI